MELKRGDQKIEAYLDNQAVGEITYSDTRGGKWIIAHVCRPEAPEPTNWRTTGQSDCRVGAGRKGQVVAALSVCKTGV